MPLTSNVGLPAGKSDQPSTAGDMQPLPSHHRRKSKLFWWLILVVAGGFLLLFFPWPRFGFEIYIDRNSGDLMTKKVFGEHCYETEIEQTPFSSAVRKYVGPPAPANWVCCDGKVNGAYEDVDAGHWPSDCRQLMMALQLVPLSNDETKAILKRCAGYLANDQRQAMDAEGMALLDRAEAQDHAATRP